MVGNSLKAKCGLKYVIHSASGQPWASVQIGEHVPISINGVSLVASALSLLPGRTLK